MVIGYGCVVPAIEVGSGSEGLVFVRPSQVQLMTMAGHWRGKGTLNEI